MAGLGYRKDWDVLESYFAFKELSSAPATPESNVVRLYAKDSSGTSTLCYKNDAGGEVCLPITGTIPTGTGTGVTGAVTFWTGAASLGLDDAHFHWDDTNDQLLIGINTGSHFGTDAGLCVDEDGASSIIGTTAHSATVTHAGGLNAQRSRGTHSAQTIVAADDRIMRIVAQAYDGAAYRDAASIDAYVDATPGSGDMPGRLVFNTTPDGSTTLTERLRITQGGQFALGLSSADITFHYEQWGGNNNDANMRLRASTADTTAPGITFQKSRGTTLAGATATLSGDFVGAIGFGGYDGSSWVFNGALLRAQAAENYAAGARGTQILFETTPLLSTTRAERFRIGPAGQWGIGGANYGTSGQVFTSGGASAAPSWATPTSTNALLDGSNHTDTLAGTVVRGDLIVGNSTPKWARLATGSAGAFVRSDGTDTAWSTLILPNAATSGRVVYASASNTYGESANVTYDGTDFGIGSGTRFRMQSQNRIRYLNSMAKAYLTSSQTGLTPNSTMNTLTLGGETTDTDGLHTTTSKITAAIAGKYIVLGQVLLDGAGTTTLHWGGIRLGINGSAFTNNIYHIVNNTDLDQGSIPIVDLFNLAAGDYVEIQGAMNAGGGTFAITAGFLCLIYVGE